jgi:hypothetical protein
MLHLSRLLGLYSQHFNRANKLECHITHGWKGLPRNNTLAYWALCKLQRKWRVVNTATDLCPNIKLEWKLILVKNALSYWPVVVVVQLVEQ